MQNLMETTIYLHAVVEWYVPKTLDFKSVIGLNNNVLLYEKKKNV
jgi:hypothetical protein